LVFTASRWGHIEVVKELLNYGANFEAKDEAGCTALIEGDINF
jgi:hypothetical protein